MSDSAESRLGGSRIATRLTSDRHAPLSSQTAIYICIYIYRIREDSKTELEIADD